MANDSVNTTAASTEQDSTPVQDSYFTDMQGEDAFFGPEQLAQAGAGGAPVQVAVPQDQNVIRVQVNPGEIIELSSPFDPGATLLGREADGNLAIRVGDVTVILVGFVEANAAAPVLVETSDGQPIDIATLLASTDPAIDIQTAAGPGEGQGGQGADNTGAILAQLAAGNGLGGLNAVGALDATQLKYVLIDNSIRLDRDDNLLSPASTGLGRFPGVAEPFLRDPFKTDNGSWLSFDDFKNEYSKYIDDHKDDAGGPGGWADFTGTTATTDDSAGFFLDTSFTVTIPHSSTVAEQLNLLDGAAFFNGPVPTSDGETLEARFLQAAPGDHSTVLLVRPSDGAVIMVFHVQEHDSTGDFHVDAYLVNRLDHPLQGQDVLNVGFHTEIVNPGSEGNPEEGQEPTPGSTVEGPSGSVDIQDDVPIAEETTYLNFLHACSFKDAADCFSAFLHGKITDYTITHDAGHVDEDYLFHGNHDKDNAFGPDSDPDRGDDIGDKFVVGILDINFGADGPSGAIPEGDKPSKDNPKHWDADPQALKIDGLEKGDPFPGATSHDNPLVVLKHYTLFGIEVLQVGYQKDCDDSDTGSGSLAAASLSGKHDDVVVFTLLLQTNPNQPLFGGFVFAQCEPLDHPVGATLETNLPLNFNIIATDDDGDQTPVTITIQSNDDAPYFSITYNNEDPQNCERGGEDVRLTNSFSDGGYGYGVHVDHFTTKDFGHVDEDWLKGATGNGGSLLPSGGSAGNHDRDGFGEDNANLYGDDKGGLEVCGQIKVKYGADGPSEADGNGDLALKEYDTTNGAHPLFVNGDGQTLTQDGKPLVVLESSPGHLVVGTVDIIDYGEGETFEDENPVFCLDLNPETGKFEFHLLGAIDHLPSTVDGQPESNLVLSFDVGFAEDFDHDHALGQINIKVNDDKPEVGITYYNEVPGSIVAGVAISDWVPTKTDHDFGRIDEDWLHGAVGNSGETYYGNQDKYADGFTSNANEFGDDYGGAHLSGYINMKVGADGLGSQTIGLETLSGAFKDADGNALTTSDGIPLVVLHSDKHLLEIGVAGQPPIFTLTLDDYGNFDFTQSKAIDHPIASPIEDNVYLNFNAGSIIDADGDRVDAVIKIQVNDDVPETSVYYTSVPPETEPVPELDSIISYGAPVNHFGEIDEDFLENGNKDQDNSPPGSPSDPARADEPGYTIVTGSIGGGTNYGADGPKGTPDGSSFGLTQLKMDDAVNDADGNQLKSHGHDLVVLSSNGDLLEVGYHNGDTDTVVFTLEMTDPTEFKFELKEPLDEPVTRFAEHGVVLVFGAEDKGGEGPGAPTDKDDDPAVRIVIHVNDDAPKLESVSYTTFTDASGEDSQTDVYFGAGGFGRVDEDNLATGQGNLDTDNFPRAPSDVSRGDTIGSHIAAGQINVDFGADGPADTAFSLSEYKAGDTFQDLDGNTYKSHGNELKVLDAAADHVTVGYGDGTSSTTVFEFHVGQDGSFGFDLQAPLDHPEPGKFDTYEGDDLPVAFAVTAIDFDGDSVTTRVSFLVNDDAPTEGTVTYSVGERLPNPDTGEYESWGAVDEDYVPGGNQDKDGGADSTDGPGGASVTATVSVPGFAPGIGADGPADHPFSLSVEHVGDKFREDLHGGTIASGFDPDELVITSSSKSELVVGHKDGSGTVFTLTLDQDTGVATLTMFQGIQSFPGGDNKESGATLAFTVLATDYDGDTSGTMIQFRVNDDRPVAINDDATISNDVISVTGNLFDNQVTGTGDGVRVTFIDGTPVIPGGSTTIVGEYGNMKVYSDGTWTFTPSDKTFDQTTFIAYGYEVEDGDGDTAKASINLTLEPNPAEPDARLASVDVGPTHDPAASYDHEVTVSGLGLNGIANPFDASTNHFKDATGGHVISGGAGNDYIEVTGDQDTPTLLGLGGLKGNGGDDIIQGGGGKDLVHGGAGDDTIFGGGNDDNLYGDAGHDAMSGGAGDDTLHVDADDLTDTNTLDGVHSIDGGDGKDTVDLSSLKTFDSGQAMHLENVEALAFDGKASGGGGTAASLNYDAAYGITQVGGLHTLSITGDKSDTLQLVSNGANTWAEIGSSHVYEAGAGASKVTVTVDHDIAVQVS